MALLGGTQESAEQQSVTEFKDAIAPEKVVVDVNPYNEASDDLTSLKRFLAKPRKVASFPVMSTSQTESSNRIDFNLFFLLNSISTKLFNYAGIRFTMCARMAVNTTPFDSGLLAMVHYPPGAGLRMASSLSREHMMKFPHVFVDMGEETAAELRVPFYSPLRFLETSRIQTPNYLGAFQVTNPVLSVFASNSTLVNVYFWIEDVELLYPTNISGGNFKVWTPQGPAPKTPSGINVVLAQPRIDNNYRVTEQTVPYAMNLVTKTYKTGSVQTFEELFQTEDYLTHHILSKNETLVSTQMPVAPCMGNNVFSRLGSISNFFYMYSGSIDIHLKLIKTKFHSGRLQIAFLPLWDPAVQVPTVWDDFWNIVWDFSEDSTISFKLPYLSNRFMTLTNPADGDTDLSNYTQGVLAFRQVTPLQCPDNVAQNIVLLITGEAGEDLQLAAPIQTSEVVYTASKNEKLAYSDSISILEEERVSEEGEKELRESWLGPDSMTNEESEPIWHAQGPPSITDKPIPNPENFVNEGVCSLSDFAQKPSKNAFVSNFTRQNGIVFPATLILPKNTYTATGTKAAVSNLTLLAGMFEFYRGDLIRAHDTAAPPIASYYTDLDGVPLTAGTTYAIPYISNLKYNSVLPVIGAPVGATKVRLQHAEFFLPWYSTAHRIFP